MADFDRNNPDDASTERRNARQKRVDAKNADARIEHHLRGAEFDEDFSDADQDSCTATHRRNDRESDS